MNDLVTIARRINDREQTIEGLKKLSLDRAGEALAEILLQGQDLLRAKASLKHGLWLPWLAKNCPAICESTAQRYMRIASNPARVQDLLKAGSLRGALALLEDDRPDSQTQDTRRWPPYLEAIGRVSKLVGYIERFPIVQWPTEGREKLREQMLPIAKELWPEKF